MVYSPGDIVEANFTKMDGKPSSSIFVVLYNEALDSNTQHNKNLVVAKVTSNLSSTDDYLVLINHMTYGLPKLSAVRVNKLNTIQVSSIFKIIGTLKSPDWARVSSKFKKFKIETARQSKTNLGGIINGKR